MSEEAEFPDVEPSQARRAGSSDPAITRANNIPIVNVAEWLGLMVDGTLRCPAERDDDERGPHTGVHVHLNGVKCPHDRCVGKGNGRGYRTPVALVAELRGVDDQAAAQLILERFDPAPKVELEQLKAFATKLKKKNDNRLASLGVHLARVCKAEKVDGDVVERLAVLLGEKFFDCDAQSIARHFRDSLPSEISLEQFAQFVIRAQRQKSAPDEPGESSEYGAIFIELDLEAMAREAERVLARSGEFFQRGTDIAQIALGTKPAKRLYSDTPTPVLRTAPYAALRAVVGRAAWLVRETEGDMPRRVLPPEWVIKTLQALTNWPLLPNVETLAECPVMRADGTIVSAPGYDEASGVYLIPNAVYPPIPDSPSSEQLRDAVAAIDDVFCDVPFAKPEHRAAAFAAILSLVGRDTFRDDPTPCFVVEAATAGSGKDNLVRLISIIGTGTTPFSSQFTEDEEEQRKRITSVAMAGLRMVLFGNVATDLQKGKGFGGAPLCDALTTTKYSGRVLGENREWSGTLKTVFFATSNNMLIGAEMDRRICPIRLDWGARGIAKPAQIPDDYWKHPNVLAYARANRPKLVAAALTILRAYFAAGCPDMRTSAWGSYPNWARTILGAVKYAGLADPGEGRQQFVQRADFNGHLKNQLMLGLDWLQRDVFRGHAMLAADILDAISTRQGCEGNGTTPFNIAKAERYKALTEALQGLVLAEGAERTVRVQHEGSVATRPVLPSAKMLGKLLASLTGAPFDITETIVPPSPPSELMAATATIDDQEILIQGKTIGWKDLDGTMVWDFLGITWCLEPDGSVYRLDTSDGDEWVEWWSMHTRHHSPETQWRLGSDGETEMWSEDEGGWVPQPRVLVRVVRGDVDRNGRVLWQIERVEPA